MKLNKFKFMKMIKHKKITIEVVFIFQSRKNFPWERFGKQLNFYF